ncbi:hypothetical protein Tco_0490289 [Tanacetum coccineum]
MLMVFVGIDARVVVEAEESETGMRGPIEVRVESGCQNALSDRDAVRNLRPLMGDEVEQEEVGGMENRGNSDSGNGNGGGTKMEGNGIGKWKGSWKWKQRVMGNEGVVDCLLRLRRRESVFHISNVLEKSKFRKWNLEIVESDLKVSYSRDNRGQQPPFKRQNISGQNVVRAYMTGNNERRGRLLTQTLSEIQWNQQGVVCYRVWKTGDHLGRIDLVEDIKYRGHQIRTELETKNGKTGLEVMRATA